jgi:type II secretory pathway component PulF
MARIGTRHLSRLCHNVGTGLHAGVDIRRVWESESHRGPIRSRHHLAAVGERIAHGEGLAASLKASNGFFPSLLCEMVEVGERTGRLEQVFLRLSDHYSQVLKLRRDFLMGIAWPMLELCAAIGVIGLLIWLLGAIGAKGLDGEPMGVFGLSGAQGAMIFFGGVFAVALALAGLLYAFQSGTISPDPFLRLLLHVPGLGNGLRTIAMSRLIWSLAIASDSDLSPDKTVELATRSAQNSYYTDHLEQMQRTIRRGNEMHEAFRATNRYPDDFLDALQTGEITGRVSETMQVLAKDYEEKARLFYRTMAVVGGVLVFLLVAGIIIFMIFYLFFTMIMPVYRDAGAI